MKEPIILGIVQGISEFLPISSSAHLILIRFLFNFKNYSETFDISLHFGTLLAILIFFSKEWLILFHSIFQKNNTNEKKLLKNIIISSIPTAIAGFLLDDIIENYFRNQLLLIALLLSIVGILLYESDIWAQKHYKIQTDINNITTTQALLIGLSQTFAIIPGFSRSGTTILTGRLIGIDKESITKYTFLLSIPIILGATLLKINELTLTKDLIIGTISSFITGILCIKFLLKYIKNHSFLIFAYYRIIITIIIILKLILI